MQTNHIHLGDNIAILSNSIEFPDNSVDCCITSPPYFQLREYNGCGMGNEKSQSEYIDKLKELFHQLHRVVKPTGTIVINLGDKYNNGCLQLLPYRFAIAILDTYKDVRLINDLTWVKSNPTPRQDTTKLVQATEPFFIFAKSKGYIFNKSSFLVTKKEEKSKTAAGATYGQTYINQINASKELTEDQKKKAKDALDAAIQDVRDEVITGIRMKIKGVHALAYGGQEGGRNNAIERDGFSIIRLHGEKMKRDVMFDDLIYEVVEEEIKRDVIDQNVETIKGNKHPAVFPVKLIEEVILLLTNETDIVLDPFMGSGTTGLAAMNSGRKYIGIEIDSEYHAYAVDRLSNKTSVL